MYQNGITWRIRLTMSDDQHNRALLRDALANKPVSAVRLEPCGANRAEITGEVMVEFALDDGLAALLEALHMISPQVFVARADGPASPASQVALDEISRKGRADAPRAACGGAAAPKPRRLRAARN